MKIFLSIICLLLLIVFLRYILRYILWGIFGATLYGFIGSIFGHGWMIFGVIIGFVGGLSAAHNEVKKPVENSSAQLLKPTEQNSEFKNKTQKKRNTFAGFVMILAIVVGSIFYATKEQPKPKYVNFSNVINVASYVFSGPFKYFLKAVKKRK